MTARLNPNSEDRSQFELRIKRLTQIGWAGTILGCLLWGWGYFATGSTPFIQWTEFAPSWISEYMINWQEELGVLLMLIASVPLYYAQLKAMPRDE
jgi:hypothetical protein